MPYDALLMPRDGTKDTAVATEAPDTVARDATRGWAVIDLKETGAKGLAAIAVFLGTSTATSTTDIKIQASDVADFASGVEDCVTFPQVLHAAIPCVLVRRFATHKRYVRSHIVVGTEVAGKIGVFLAYHPWKTV